MSKGNLFNEQALLKATQSYADFKETDDLKAKEIFERWVKAKGKEEQLQSDFLNEIFGDILGYKYKRDGEYNIEKEIKTEVDGKKPDGVLGFFNEKQDVRVVIELKGKSINLDNKQNDGKTPVEQAFSYTSKIQGVEWVILSNFKEIRLYKDFQGKYHLFNIEELAESKEKRKEFRFLLAKDRLFTKVQRQSPIYSLVKPKTLVEIENEFYQKYKKKRTIIKEELIKTNKEKTLTSRDYLYISQKLLDRMLFIAFCIKKEILLREKVEKRLYDEDYTFKERLNKLFELLNTGKPETAGIPKLNGGLFAEDEDLKSLEISEEAFNQLAGLYQYDFTSELDVNILGHIFEQSITDLEKEAEENTGQRKKDGIFYTPKEITRYIIENTIGKTLQEWKSESKTTKEYVEKLKQITICDPACGSGAFLVEVFQFLKEKWQETGVDFKEEDILKNNIYGVDINIGSIGITKLSLWLQSVSKNSPLISLENTIKIGDSVIDNEKLTRTYNKSERKGETFVKNIDILNYNSKEEAIEKGVEVTVNFKWQKEFPEVFANGGFDVVVGNPPYVRQERLGEMKRILEDEYEVYSGTADLYCYFYEKGCNILKPNGRLGFITSNKWMRAKYGEKLRNFILRDTKIEKFIDFKGEKIFETASVDSNILIFKRQKAQGYTFEVGDNLKNLHEFESKNLSKDIFNIEGGNLERSIKQKMEKLGKPLKNWDVKINYGIKTGFNDAFIIDTKTKEELCKKDPKSEEIIKPVLRGRDVSRYGYEWADLWIIFTRRGADIEKFPAIKNHLMQYYEDLKPKNNNEKKGRKAGSYKWFEIQDNIAYYEDFGKEKIVWPCIMTKESAFAFNDDKQYVLAPGNIIVGKDIKYLTCILNSKLVYFAFVKFYMGGGIAGELKTNNLEQLPIPKISQEEQEPFVKKAQEMLALTKQFNELSSSFLKLLSADLRILNITKKLENWHNLKVDEFFAEVAKQNKNLSLSAKSEWIKHFEEEKKKALALQNQINKTDNEIDVMVYKLYNLTEEEIEIIESAS
jgi:hypothetical protein